MTTTEAPTVSLYAALDAAAPDRERWIAGKDAFYDALQADKTVDEAYYDALDAAAPDEEHWKIGYAALFGLEYTDTPPSFTDKAKNGIKKTASRTRDSVKTLFTTPRRTLAAPDREGSSS